MDSIDAMQQLSDIYQEGEGTCVDGGEWECIGDDTEPLVRVGKG